MRYGTFARISFITAAYTVLLSAQCTLLTVTVVGWVDGNVPTPTDANPLLSYNLYNYCSAEVGLWASGFRKDVLTQEDANYANAFLLQHSANTPPPARIVPGAFAQQIYQYRIFNSYSFNYASGLGVPGIARAGNTPNPCPGSIGVPDWVTAGQASQFNGQWSYTPAGKAYQIAEVRVGTIGQRVNQTLNQTSSTPWIWTVIQFDANGGTDTSVVGIYPKYSVYINGLQQNILGTSNFQPFVSYDGSLQFDPANLP